MILNGKLYNTKIMIKKFQSNSYRILKLNLEFNLFIFSLNKNNEFMSAADLKPGQKAIIVSLENNHPSCYRLIEYGFTPGQEIELINSSLFKDPLQFSIRGTLVALRRNDAKCIKVIKH